MFPFNNHLRSAWEIFISQHRLTPSTRPLITPSWERCWGILDPYHRNTPVRLSAGHLLSLQVSNFDLLSIARPIMEDIHQYIERSSTIVVLVNQAGYVLDLLGDEGMINAARECGILTGVTLSESQTGTNAFCLALIERLPAQVSGAEHYLQQFHRFSDSAAPIFDLTGSVLGALGVLSFARNAHPHSLGLVAAGARAIESQRQADHLLGEQNSQLAGLNAILSTISEGILVWNREGVVIHANPAATHLLDLSEDALRGARIESTVKFPAYIEQALAAQEVVSDVEANLAIQDRSINCVLSLRYVGHSKGQQATIAILRRTQEVRQLVQRQFGAQMVFTLDHLVGRSAEIQSVRRSAQIAAAARASVLIYGESGTGKNLLAHAIHNHGPQRDGPFIILACTAIPSELILTELSGLEEGADGRRSGGRPGKFELADGGTILFKDIEALPLEAQAVLLNVLELGIVQRLGSRRPIQVNVRVIAITTHNLRQAVQEGRFRSELFYRLSPFEISLPPLRERFGDLPLLVNSFLERINRQQDQPVRVSPEAMVILQEHHWPGNIRELESVLAQAALRAGSLGQILPEHLPDFVRFPEKHAEEEKRLIPLDEVERLALLKAARACKGNVSLMARSLGIGRTTVWRRLKQLDISPDQFREN